MSARAFVSFPQGPAVIAVSGASVGGVQFVVVEVLPTKPLLNVDFHLESPHRRCSSRTSSCAWQRLAEPRVADKRTAMALEQQAVGELLQGALDLVGPAPDLDAATERADLNAATLDCYVALARQSLERFEEAARG